MAFKRLLALMVLGLGMFAASLAAAHADPVRIVALGDSLMAGYQLDPGESFAEKLEAALQQDGHDVVMTNAAVPGDTSTGGLARLQWSVPEDTDMVVLGLGANDMLRGITPDITERNLRGMIEWMQENDIRIVLTGMLAAPNLGPDYGAAFNAIYPRLAEEYGVAFVPFLLDGVAAQRDMLLEDGMHPNAPGVDRMVEGVLPVVVKSLSARASET